MAKVTAFLQWGFRPLYAAGCSWAILAIAVWIFAPHLLSGPMAGVAWHAHEMLWGFVATIAVGFLLTASASWTGFNPLKGPLLGLLCVLWLIARIGYLTDGLWAFRIACISETAFFIMGALAVLRVVIKGKSKRNYGIPALVLGLGLANVLYLQAVLGSDYAVLMQRFDLGLICMAIIALLIARRVIPFFAVRMVPGLHLPMQTRSGQSQWILGIAAIIASVTGQLMAAAMALAVIGLIGLCQLVSWKPWAVRHKPLLWILYIGYAGLAAGLLAAAAYMAGMGPAFFARSAVHVHIIAMGGFSVLIIGMATRSALGHSGRPLALDRSMLASYGFVIAAVVARFAALWPTPAAAWLLHAAAACWIAAFGLYLWRFLPMLLCPCPEARHR